MQTLKINENAEEKKKKLISILRGYGRVAVAFSGGVDSTFLLHTAFETLGENAVALTGNFISFPARENDASVKFCEERGIRQIRLTVDQNAIEGFRENTPQRCYFCKKALFSAMIAAAKNEGFDTVAEGSNADDVGDFRPGMKAIAELGVKSPLLEAGLTKDEIRCLSKEAGLETWNKPSLACLATRIPYGEIIRPEILSVIEKAENKLLDLGFRQLRVRYHGEIARIEIDKSEFARAADPEISKEIDEYFRSLGFRFVTLDLGGYKTGKMNPQSETDKK